MYLFTTQFSPIQLIIGSIVLVSVFLIFIILLVRSYIKRIRENELEKRLIQKKHANELISNSLKIQEKERSRIAADIHDDLIGRIRHLQLLNTDAKQTKEFQTCISIARSISHDLSPPLIHEINLESLFHQYLDPLESTHELHVIAHESPDIIIRPEIKLNIYRIFQELITNIEKHAQSKKIWIHLRVGSKSIALLVRDDGIGINSSTNKGLGMKNISLRAHQLNAKFKFSERVPKGTKFIFLCKHG